MSGVHVFVEGGGQHNKTRTECRKAFRLFFERFFGEERSHPRISACGGRDEAYRDFCRSLQTDTDILAILLVDSEQTVPVGKSSCSYLQDRDRWTDKMPEQQVYLMVQCMESGFLADSAALEDYYGGKFKAGALPVNHDIEAVSKRDTMEGLARATKDTTKGEYHKTRHGFDLLGRIDPRKVNDGSFHARALLTFLDSRLPKDANRRRTD